MPTSRIRLRSLALLILFSLACFWLLGGSSLPAMGKDARLRAFTRAIEFDFLDWTLEALAEKLDQSALAATRYLPPAKQSQIVLEYLELINHMRDLEREVSTAYADPSVGDPEASTAAVRGQLEGLQARQRQLEPLAESILQSQLQTILTGADLTLGGQTLPPILYRTTPPPLALIVSPRDAIRKDYHLAIDPSLSTEERAGFEDRIDEALDVSSLTVPVGGIGLYPTMIMQTSDINFLAEVVAHEWIHNFLTLRPLGALYFESPQLTTINETVASIAGKELGRLLVERYYPEYLPPPPAPLPPETSEPAPEPPAFDFNHEMGETRRTVDDLLAQGKVEEAEAYMEARRQVFWENGYHLRKINQAYFAFYGAYADEPGGAAGEDPVGEAVRALRLRSESLAEFVKRVSWISSFEGLQRLLVD